MTQSVLGICTICATIFLAGCSYFDTGKSVDVQNDQAVRIDLIHGHQSVEELTDISAVVRASTNGSVELFGFDDMNMSFVQEHIQEPLPVDSVLQHGKVQRLMSEDSNVQIFPLDGVVSDVMPFSSPVSFLSSQSESMNLITRQYVDSSDLDMSFVSAPDVCDVIKIYFDHDSSTLDYVDLAQIDLVSRIFDAKRDSFLSVEGHASVRANYSDTFQRKMVNLKISMDRALNVAKGLVKKGVPVEAIRTVAWGDARQSVFVDGKDAESASRRVEIIMK
ncbi:MAG: OmpA family protein [Alphaproteobacteria bacterium]|nr:OmpA family protein [Alphaproteobacteria bacterium]